MLKKLLTIPLLTMLIVFGNVASARAVDVFQNACSGSTSTLCAEAGKNQTQADNGLFGVNGILGKVSNLLLVVIGVVAVILIMVGGIQYALSAGDAQKVKRAKDVIIYAIIGMFIAVLAKGIIAFVINKVA